MSRKISEDFYTSRVTVEVTVRHQFLPQDGIDLITALLNCGAITSVDVKSVESNFKLHGAAENGFYTTRVEKLR